MTNEEEISKIKLAYAFTLSVLNDGQEVTADTLAEKENLAIRNPEDHYAHLDYAAALQTTGDLDNAFTHYQKALELAPENQKRDFNMWCGKCAMEMGNGEEAFRYLAASSGGFQPEND